MSDPIRDALAELVALKDLHDKCERWPSDTDANDDDSGTAMWAEYQRRKPIAWANARAALAASEHTPNASLPPLGDGPRRKIFVTVEVPEDWESRLDMQWVLEREIHADRWLWDWPTPAASEQEAQPAAWQSPDGSVREDEGQGEPPFDDWRPLYTHPQPVQKPMTDTERDAAIDRMLAERGWPTSPKNAARAGWYAALSAYGIGEPKP